MSCRGERGGRRQPVLAAQVTGTASGRTEGLVSKFHPTLRLRGISPNAQKSNPFVTIVFVFISPVILYGVSIYAEFCKLTREETSQVARNVGSG